MTKEELFTGQAVFHTNRQQIGAVRKIDTIDPTSVIVEFDDCKEVEVSLCFLVPSVHSGDFL